MGVRRRRFHKESACIYQASSMLRVGEKFCLVLQSFGFAISPAMAAGSDRGLIFLHVSAQLGFEGFESLLGFEFRTENDRLEKIAEVF